MANRSGAANTDNATQARRRLRGGPLRAINPRAESSRAVAGSSHSGKNLLETWNSGGTSDGAAVVIATVNMPGVVVVATSGKGGTEQMAPEGAPEQATE